jgi:hypothetical protein
MHLGRDFGDSEFTGDLLVHQTRRDQAQYLLFTAGQCLEMCTRLQYRTFSDATATIALERELNRIDKILFAEWFGQEFDRAPFMARTVIGISPCPLMKMIGR